MSDEHTITEVNRPGERVYFHPDHQNDITHKGLSIAFWLNLSFSVIEVVGGYLTNSTAIISDAFHDFMDALAIGSAVYLEKLSGKKRTSRFSFGYKRFSLLSALALSLFLITGAVLMIVSAIRSFIHPETVDSVGMLWLAVLGIVINGLAYLKVKGGGDAGHEHVHTHAHVHQHGGKLNQNSKAVMLHMLEDVLGWIAVLVGAGVMYFTDWYWIDGLLAICIALFIGNNAVRILSNTMKILLQSVPEDVDIDQLTADLQHIDGVVDIHDLHLWSLDGAYNVSSLHALIDAGDHDREKRIYNAIVEVMQHYHIHHHTIQLETSDANCGMHDCDLSTH